MTQQLIKIDQITMKRRLKRSKFSEIVVLVKKSSFLMDQFENKNNFRQLVVFVTFGETVCKEISNIQTCASETVTFFSLCGWQDRFFMVRKMSLFNARLGAQIILSDSNKILNIFVDRFIEISAFGYRGDISTSRISHLHTHIDGYEESEGQCFQIY